MANGGSILESALANLIIAVGAAAQAAPPVVPANNTAPATNKPDPMVEEEPVWQPANSVHPTEPSPRSP